MNARFGPNKHRLLSGAKIEGGRLAGVQILDQASASEILAAFAEAVSAMDMVYETSILSGQAVIGAGLESRLQEYRASMESAPVQWLLGWARLVVDTGAPHPVDSAWMVEFRRMLSIADSARVAAESALSSAPLVTPPERGLPDTPRPETPSEEGVGVLLVAGIAVVAIMASAWS